MCLCRAVADQLEGDEEQHAKYRQLVVDYLEVRISSHLFIYLTCDNAHVFFLQLFGYL